MSASGNSLKDKKTATKLAHAGRDPQAHNGAVNVPVYQVSTILKPSYAAWKEARQPGYPGYIYGTKGTPTSRSFEAAVAELYGAKDVFATTSGLAAVTHPFLGLLQSGDHVLVTDSAYRPCRAFCDGFLSRYGVATTYYDPTIGAGIADLIQPNTKLVWTESPGSQTFEVQDIPAIAEAAHEKGCLVGIDNTWGTALGLDALGKGCDIVVEAVTKYIGGHSDLLMGLVATGDRVGPELRQTAKLIGDTPSGEMYALANRGLRTMKLRFEKSFENSLKVAAWFERQPLVKRVIHPGLPSHPQHDLWKRDFTGGAGLFAVILESRDDAAIGALMDGLSFFGIGASWGGYESLILADDPAKFRTVTEWTEEGQLLRLYTGLEDADDLIEDLAAGLDRYARIVK
ncbi:MAG: cystathionine beta-lyase [Alphaproteobacteria bacterium]|nr:cystathionine beta-lyase [Alphaproteobacteria bacterium]